MASTRAQRSGFHWVALVRLHGDDAIRPPGAAVARLVTARDHGVPLRWAEQRSRDTNDNARYSVAMPQADGITLLVLV